MNAVDTNVLIYACDTRDPVRQERALRLIGELRDGVLPWQVACEFIAASRKLAPHGFTTQAAWARLATLMRVLPLIPPSPGALDHARQIHLGRQIAFWDAMILGACFDAGITACIQRMFRAPLSMA